MSVLVILKLVLNFFALFQNSSSIFNKYILSEKVLLQIVLLSQSCFPTFAFSVTPLCPCLSLCVSHSLVFVKYWPNEFLMDLVGRVQTLWDSGVWALITLLLLLLLLQSPPSSFLSLLSLLLSLSHPPSLLLSLHPSPSPPGLVFLSPLFPKLGASGSFTYPSSCDKDTAGYTCVWMYCYRQITDCLSIFSAFTDSQSRRWPHPPHPHTLALVVSHIHAKAELG